MMEVTRRGEWLSGTIREADAGVRLGDLLRQRWGLPRKTVHLLFQQKEILLDGEPAAQHATVQAGQAICMRLCPPEPLGLEPSSEPLDVLYEDDHLLVVAKPAGLLLHPTEKHHTRTLDHLVAGHFARTGVKAKVRHVHRLDQETSGAVLYAKHALASALLDERLRMRQIKRTYVAFVHGRMAKEAGTIDAPIGKDRHHPSRRRVTPNGDPAVTHYRVLERYRQATEVECHLDTGRTHQIRVHLSHLGHPLLGDLLYGGKTGDISRQALHAARLHLVHPFGDKEIVVTAPLPEDMIRLKQRLPK
ncbi:RluA family pseudouridine synthase [Brevibacillus sp. SYP-B805]|uniref:RluA family pseudouridine synthase n=1 Tax=Brevibacillus sp. SYP-B805 TaxID=1578199 RepID=UPI0013EBCF3B|nr:RluA family pseudouridine synthase [Brevibacillus sp. SYP-B805]NGQ97324.1 RluA family pseudouridine synthase [Brevibacillus sp. SYP-B805]